MGFLPPSAQPPIADCHSRSDSRNSPVDNIVSSVVAVREALSPVALESMIRGAVKDLESSFRLAKWKDCHHKEQKMDVLKANKQCSEASKSCLLSVEEPNKGPFIKFPLKAAVGNIFQHGNKSRKAESTRRNSTQVNVGVSPNQSCSTSSSVVDEAKPCGNCLFTAFTRALVLGSIFQAIPNHLKTVKKCFGKHSFHATGTGCDEEKAVERNAKFVEKTHPHSSFQILSVKGRNLDSVREREDLSFEVFLNFVLEYCHQSGLKLLPNKKQEKKECTDGKVKKDFEIPIVLDIGWKPFLVPNFKDIGFLQGIFEGGRKDKKISFAKLSFARIGGTSDVLVDPSTKEDSGAQEAGTREVESKSAQKLTAGIFNASLTNVERLKSTLSAISLAELKEQLSQIGRSQDYPLIIEKLKSTLSAIPLTELKELMPQIGKSQDYPDLKQLFSFQHVFDYAQTEGRRFFEELDRDGDGQVTLEDLEIAMRKRRLPRRYAREFLWRTRTHMFAKSIGWEQFLSLMKQKEPTIVSAYISLSLSKSGTLKRSQVLAILKSQALPATDENVAAMMRILDAHTKGFVSYGHFHNFMLLLPPERLEDNPRSLWFEAATVVPVAPPVTIPAGSVLKSALAGGLSCALSTSLMHPLDTMKTRVQASALSFPELVSKLPQIGLRGLYRGSIPAILGQFVGHGLRTGTFEASKLLLMNFAPTLTDIQVQSFSSSLSSLLGTAVRIPCEVLKQRLQAGVFDNLGGAIVCTWKQDGLKGFFRGTAATLCREVPFYAAGHVLYNEAKKVVQQLANRELTPWECFAVGAVSGGLAAVVTTPFDVMKTRMMTAPPGVPTTMHAIAFIILKQEGPLGLFKGAVPRFFWVAPLGAMNFAGYELARKAMDKADDNDN